jgi:cyclomaltodextrinase / maltogenic alpha-amylase / neopullulanase
LWSAIVAGLCLAAISPGCRGRNTQGVERLPIGAHRLDEATVPDPVTEASPEATARGWSHGDVVYGVYPPLFGDEPLAGVTARLDDLEALGIDALWLSPVMQTTDPDDFGYAVTDYLRVRPDYGTDDDLRLLVDEAHARDIRVILDFVPNHTSVEHPWFTDPHRHDWYERDEHGRPQHYFDWTHLPNLDYDHPKVVDSMRNAFGHWVREFDVDGFRVDAAWGIRQRNPEMWPVLLADLRRIDPDLWFLAEASAQDGHYLESGFDAAYDWTEQIGQWSWEGLFEQPEQIGPRLDVVLDSGAAPPHRIARFLNNNDTGERFITRHGPAITRVAATLLLTLPGIPVLYTGDEVGAEYLPYDVDGPLVWDDPHGLRPHYEKLAHLRERLPGLAGSGFTRVATDRASSYAYLRHGEDGADPVLVVLEFGEGGPLVLSFDETPAAFERRESVVDVLGERTQPAQWLSGLDLRLEIPPTSAMILLPRPAPASSSGGRRPKWASASATRPS